jgi:hypothetical protein
MVFAPWKPFSPSAVSSSIRYSEEAATALAPASSALAQLSAGLVSRGCLIFLIDTTSDTGRRCPESLEAQLSGLSSALNHPSKPGRGEGRAAL